MTGRRMQKGRGRGGEYGKCPISVQHGGGGGGGGRDCGGGGGGIIKAD